jgi:hypothetical protein
VGFYSKEMEELKMAIEVCNCPISQASRFCGQAVVEGDVCLVPGLRPADIKTVESIIDPDNLRVQLVCCSIIVVCGFITKRITLNDTAATVIEEDLPFQAHIPAEINDPTLTAATAWEVTGADICSGCYTLLCATANGTFHNLREKDIITIEVSRVVTPPPGV